MAMEVLVVQIWQIMSMMHGGDDGDEDEDEDDGGADAADDGDDDAEGADAADDGCEGAMGNGSNCYDYERCIDSNYDEDDGEE